LDLRLVLPSDALTGGYRLTTGPGSLDGKRVTLDFTGDGNADLVIRRVGARDTIVVQAPLGSEVWRYVLPASEVCPSCSNISTSLIGFGQFDPTPGREALLSWSSVGASGLALANALSQQVLWTFDLGNPNQPETGVQFISIADLDADGFDEILLIGLQALGNQIQIWGTPGTASAPSGIGLSPPLSAIPNPTRLRSAIQFQAPSRGTATVTLFDVSGRRVRRIEIEACGPGACEALWDGRDESGGDVPSGTYFCDVAFAGGKAFTKVTVLR
jgi:hypothetical protein